MAPTCSWRSRRNASRDPLQQALLGAVRSFVGAGVGVAVVLHDVNLASAWCDRVAVMTEGRIVAEGAPAAALSAELLQRVYQVTMQRIDQVYSDRPAFLAVPSATGAGAPAKAG